MEASEKGRQPVSGLAASLFVRCFSDDWRERRIEGQRDRIPSRQRQRAAVIVRAEDDGEVLTARPGRLPTTDGRGRKPPRSVQFTAGY